MSLPASPSDRQAGFTLVEVLLAVALLALIGAMVFGSLVATTRAIETGRASAAREQMVRQVLRVMAEELSVGISDSAFPWAGINSSQDGQPADALAFLAMSDGLGLSAAKDTERIRVVYAREGTRLIRFVRRNLQGLTDESLDQVELASGVTAFNVRYFDNQARVWVDEWAFGKNSPPKALLLEITFQSSDAEPVTVREWITIGVS